MFVFPCQDVDQPDTYETNDLPEEDQDETLEVGYYGYLRNVTINLDILVIVKLKGGWTTF